MIKTPELLMGLALCLPRLGAPQVFEIDEFQIYLTKQAISIRHVPKLMGSWPIFKRLTGLAKPLEPMATKTLWTSQQNLYIWWHDILCLYLQDISGENEVSIGNNPSCAFVTNYRIGDCLQINSASYKWLTFKIWWGASFSAHTVQFSTLKNCFFKWPKSGNEETMTNHLKIQMFSIIKVYMMLNFYSRMVFLHGHLYACPQVVVWVSTYWK